MKKILITGANSFIGTSVEQWLMRGSADYVIDTVDTLDGKWHEADFSKYDTVFHVAGIAHVNPKPDMAPLYYKVNCDLAIEVAKHAKQHGIKQFIFMSSMIVYHASTSLKETVIDSNSKPSPNDFYGDSKLQAENGIKELESPDFRICILRPSMIYGTNSKGNFQRLARLATKTPIFPAWHNKRSMLYIDNLCEFVKQAIDRNLAGTFHLQNKEYADTVHIVRFYARRANHRLWCSRILNPFVWLGALAIKPLCKMFSNLYYEPSLTTYDFEYQLVSFEESLNRTYI